MSQNTETSIPSGIDDILIELFNNITTSVNSQIAFNKSREENLINFNKVQTTNLNTIIDTANQISEYLQIFKSQTHNNNDITNERVVKYFKLII